MVNNELMVKEVNFNGTNLMACKSNESQKVYVGVSYICNGLGLSKSQKDTQIQKIQNDKVLKKGCLKFQAGVFDTNNETLAIELEFMPLWLAKINITPTIEKENPELADKLEDYQLKAKEVLAKAFIEKVNTALDAYLTLDEEDRAIAYFTKAKENKQLQLELKTVNAVIEESKDDIEMAKKLFETDNAFDIGNFSKILSIKGLGRNNFYEYLRYLGLLMSSNAPYQAHNTLFKVIAIDNAYQSTKTLIRVSGVKYVIKKLIKDGYLNESFNIEKTIQELGKCA